MDWKTGCDDQLTKIRKTGGEGQIANGQAVSEMYLVALVQA